LQLSLTPSLQNSSSLFVVPIQLKVHEDSRSGDVRCFIARKERRCIRNIASFAAPSQRIFCNAAFNMPFCSMPTAGSHTKKGRRAFLLPALLEFLGLC
jgi:hypothetical protein